MGNTYEIWAYRQMSDDSEYVLEYKGEDLLIVLAAIQTLREDGIKAVRLVCRW